MLLLWAHSFHPYSSSAVDKYSSASSEMYPGINLSYRPSSAQGVTSTLSIFNRLNTLAPSTGNGCSRFTLRAANRKPSSNSGPVAGGSNPHDVSRQCRRHQRGR